MQRRWALLVTAAIALGACAGPRVPELAYLPPSGLPPAGRSAFVQQHAPLVWGNILDRLQQQGVELTEVDERAGRMVVEYRGDPEPFVDCGWIVSYDRNGLERVPASAAASEFLGRREGDPATLARELRLEARMTVEVEPNADASVVGIETLYEVTKTVAAARSGLRLNEETITFRTGDSAAFDMGTVCQPNGRLERLVFDALPAISVAGR